MYLDDNALLNIKGGLSKKVYYIAFGIGSVITFLAGVFSGYMNPNRCNN